MIEEYINKLKPYVEKYFKDDYTGHDIGHLERTMKNAIYICEKEDGDKVITGIAAYLHDIHRILQSKEGKFVSPKESLPVIKSILSNIDLTEEQIEKICYCIEYHEEYNWNGNNVSDKNALILQDADNLEAIGAIGIGRAFNYGGAYNIDMYDENTPLIEENDYVEANGDDETTIHHFYHKLFKLGDNMNTKTAKIIAEARIKFMKEFTKEFLKEWEGKF